MLLLPEADTRNQMKGKVFDDDFVIGFKKFNHAPKNSIILLSVARSSLF